MIFLGTTFFSGKYTLSPLNANIDGISQIQMTDGTYDHLFISANPEMGPANLHDEWDEHTVLNAEFNDNLEAGNSGFSLKNTDTMVIKIREKGTMDWKTIETRKVENVEDFNLYGIYRYARNNTDYELMLLSTIAGIENSYVVREVRSEFDGMYLIGNDGLFGTVYDLDGCDTTRNTSSSIVNLLNNRYASVYSNGISNYDSGSVTGTFLKLDPDSGLADEAGGIGLRREFIDFLCDQKPKVLKLFDGRIWLVRITDTPSDTQNGHPDLRQITFSWVEIGDVNSVKDLYQNGLTDVTSEWW